MICNAEDLSPDQMAAVETLLGRRVQAGEAVSVRTFEPVGISHHRRLEIADELRKYFAEEHLCKASKAISYAPGRSERWPLRPKISVLFRPDLSGRPIYRCAAELRRTPQRSKIRDVYKRQEWIGPRYEGGKFYAGYWGGPRGRVEHDHAWDRDRNRDYDRFRDRR